MKKVGIVLLVVIVVVAVIVGLALLGTRGLPQAADAFFRLIGQGQTHAAYLATAREFQAATTEAEFQDFLKTTALAEFESAAWSSRTIAQGVGKLEGTVILRGGSRIPVNLDLVKEGGGWKILAVRKADAGLVKAATEKGVPPQAEQQRLATDAIVALGEAIKGDDFAGFYVRVSKLWQSQTKPEELRAAFESFIEKKIDLTTVKEETPVFSDKPAIDEEGALHLDGYFTVKPAPVKFKLKFIYEHPDWKLISVNVNM
jgi:Sec-independent protein translocase protein TatA